MPLIGRKSGRRPKSREPRLPPLAIEQVRPSVSWRSLLLGLIGVVVICGLTPYNDYALNNTFLVGNNLPLGVVMLTFFFAVGVNGPLSRFRPRHALTSGEMAVAFSMMLVACALPSSGYMRYWPGSLVGTLYQAQSDAEFRALLEQMHLPSWIWPKFASPSPQEWTHDPVVEGYMNRWTGGGPIPYAAWIRPAITWGIFLFALYGALMCLVTMVRKQWSENERLPFPLAQIELALVEQPSPGRFFNEIFSTRSFWVAFGGVFALHLLRGLSRYFPQYIPEIPVWYDISNLMTERPWSVVDYKVKNAAIFFTVLGVTYFLTTPVAFSLWFFFIAEQLYKVFLDVRTGDPVVRGRADETFGGVLAFALAILWIGRAHWKMILAQAFRGRREGEPRGRYLSYRTAFWGMVVCYGIMVGWLKLAGCSALAAAVMVALLLMTFMILARIIAEAGLVHGALYVPVHRPFSLLAQWRYGRAVSVRTFFYGSLLQAVHFDMRETMPVYASHGFQVADQTAFAGQDLDQDGPEERKTGRKIVAALGLALLVGYAVSLTSTLWTEYHYDVTQDVRGEKVNNWGANLNPQYQVLGPDVQYDKGAYFLDYSPAKHLTFGFLFTIALSVLRLRFTWWPLHPVGYLILDTFPSAHLWFSIFLGWLCKVLIVRFGGGKWYQGAKPFFIGLIVGESMAAAFWLVTGIVLSSMNLTYRAVNIMPG